MKKNCRNLPVLYFIDIVLYLPVSRSEQQISRFSVNAKNKNTLPNWWMDIKNSLINTNVQFNKI